MNERVGLITGATSAIGRAAALRLGASGAELVLTGRDSMKGEQIAKEVVEAGGRAEFVAADLTDVDAAETLVGTISRRKGRLDFAINNAGGTLDVVRPLVDHTVDDWDRVLDLNLKALWLTLRAEIRWMREHDGGAIVNTIGVVGFDAIPNLAAYTASKHGAVGLTKAAAIENAAAGIRVNGVAPGITERLEPAAQAAVRARRAGERVPMGRIAGADEVAAAAAWLCSSESSFVTGHILVVDGGWLAQI